MLKFKGCPRCAGDLFFDQDYYGHYEQCVQCGHMRYLPEHDREEKLDWARRRKLVAVSS